MSKKLVFLLNLGRQGSPLGTETGVSGIPTAPHGLILGEGEATARTELLEAFLAQYWPIWGPF